MSTNKWVLLSHKPAEMSTLMEVFSNTRELDITPIRKILEIKLHYQ